MRQSTLFTKTRRDAPSDEIAKNAQLLIRAGYVHKEMAGVYDYLPLGLMVLENIKQIIREEMDAIGGKEIIMSSLQRKELWEETDRWSDKNVDVWFKSKLAAGGDVGFGWSHEEPITSMMKQFIASYRDLPVYVYQFQNKFRNELRAKSGIMRGREFVMKDMYSYTADAAAHKVFYDAAIEAYFKVFKRVGLGDRTFLTLASGGAFTFFSHEFQTISDVGEDTIYVDKNNISVNKEVLDNEELSKGLFLRTGFDRESAKEYQAVETGNIFDFGGIKSEQLGLSYKDETDQSTLVHLGSYGIGITRLMGILVETFADEKGIVWPESVAPFKLHLVSLGKDGDETSKVAEELYNDLVKKGASVLFDDRDASAGQKFADSDLLGMPWRIVAGRDAAGGMFEVVNRATGEVVKKSKDEVLEM
jgi:prolyl-tRNA synthetase